MAKIEMNNIRRDAVNVKNQIKGSHSPVVEVFSAMTAGRSLPKYSDGRADKAVKYIENLYAKADAHDMTAVSEINELRRFAMEPILMQEINLLSIFGNYRQIGYNESCEIEVPSFVGIGADIQDLGEDVRYPATRLERVPVPTITISVGSAVDYRKAQIGDMTLENQLQDQIRVAIRNKAARYVMETTYNIIKNAGGVKYFVEDAGLTKTNVDKLIADVRRWGRVNIVGDYALLAEFNGLAGYQGTTPSVTGIPDSIMENIHSTGLMGMYNGAVLQEIPNPYDMYTMNEDGDNFATVLPTGVGYVLPQGMNSPIWTVTRGGLTSFSGNDVTTGNILTRYDLEVGCVIPKGREYMIGMIVDTNLTTF